MNVAMHIITTAVTLCFQSKSFMREVLNEIRIHNSDCQMKKRDFIKKLTKEKEIAMKFIISLVDSAHFQVHLVTILVDRASLSYDKGTLRGIRLSKKKKIKKVY